MYAVKQDGAFAGYADSIVPIRLHSNGCYVPCEEAEADGFCAKMAVTLTDACPSRCTWRTTSA